MTKAKTKAQTNEKIEEIPMPKTPKVPNPNTRTKPKAKEANKKQSRDPVNSKAENANKAVQAIGYDKQTSPVEEPNNIRPFPNR